METLHKPDIEDTLIQEHVAKVNHEKDVHAMLRNAEQRETEEEFTKLCINRLAKTHNIEHYKAAKEKHLLSLRKAKEY